MTDRSTWPVREPRTGPSAVSRQRLRSALSAVVVVVLLGLAGLVLASPWRITYVVTGSMRPQLPVGSLVVSRPVPIDAVRSGDVINFTPPGRSTSVTHRVARIETGPSGPVLRTKGDSNPAVDEWRLDRGTHVYAVAWSAPRLGYVPWWLHRPAGRLVTTLVPAYLLAGLFLWWLWRPYLRTADAEPVTRAPVRSSRFALSGA